MVAGNSVAALKRRIAEIEGRDLCFEEPLVQSGVRLGSAPAVNKRSALPHWTLGLDAVDGILPNGGLNIAGLHEVMAEYPHMPAAGGFCAALVVRLLRGLSHSDRRTVLWCARGQEARAFGAPYGPGLADMGLAPDNLIFVRAEKTPDLLWAMEEGIKTPALAGVVGEVGPADLAASRRLLLAARKSGVPGIILRGSADHGPSVAMTTWRIESLLSGPDEASVPGAARWRVTLERVKGASSGGENAKAVRWPQSWNLEWNRETHTFNMAAVLGNQQDCPETKSDRSLGEQDCPETKSNRPDCSTKREVDRSSGAQAKRKSA